MFPIKKLSRLIKFIALCSALLPLVLQYAAAGDWELTKSPLFVSSNQPPLVMLVMGRNHKLYYDSYNDASDIDGDGLLDINYKSSIDYYGYFDSYKCYKYSDPAGRFNPTSLTTDKKCTGPDEWAGDFLNYVTMSRMDALRQVLYGGLRSTDTVGETVVERSHIPQDSHSYGKEYTSVAKNGYDIRDYTPLDQPFPGYRHILANVTLAGGDKINPRLRVLTDTGFTIQNWLSKQRPVAGIKCSKNAGSGSEDELCTSRPPYQPGSFTLVPASFFRNLNQTVYHTPNTSSIGNTASPRNKNEFDTFENYWVGNSDDGGKCGSGSASEINGSGNPWKLNSPCFSNGDKFMTIFEGEIKFDFDGYVKFGVNGDDAVDFSIDGEVLSSYYGAHYHSGVDKSVGVIFEVEKNKHYSFKYRHHDNTRGDRYELYYNRYTKARDSILKDYFVRAKVCDETVGLESNCKRYGANSWKPVGLLQKYGESEQMNFGLMTGSYENNTSGGVLRKNVSSFTNEVDLNTGVFSSTVGIVKTIDRIKTVGLNGGGSYESPNCKGFWNEPLQNGKCVMWGNPVAEMMYETVRYFAGKSEPTPEYVYTDAGSIDGGLGLPLATWIDPYDNNFPICSKPIELVISDINPNYDSDQLPGSAFDATFSETKGIEGLNVNTVAQSIWSQEVGASGRYYIGDSIGNNPAKQDSAPTPKTVEHFGKVRGLSPEEPSMEGSYYAASVAHYAKSNDINPAPGRQTMDTFSVALASPLPTIDITTHSGHKINVIPFGRTVGGCSTKNLNKPDSGDYLPTNKIVDFYVSSFTPTSGKFLVNFEDVEYGNDYDLDALQQYEYKLNDDNTVEITVTSTASSGCAQQHMGYVISGTTKDGTYFDVVHHKHGNRSTIDYFMDTPPGVWAPENYETYTGYIGKDLPLTSTRTFSPGTTDAASFLKDPLWYASKWGGYVDLDSDGTLSDEAEWDADQDGIPNSYFLVTNALGLGTQLSAVFNELLSRKGAAAAVAVSSGLLNPDSLSFQAQFDPASWSGNMLAYELNEETGFSKNIAWEAADVLSGQDYDLGRNIVTFNGAKGVPFRWPADPAVPKSNEISIAQSDIMTQGFDEVVFGLTKAEYGEKLIQYTRGLQSDEDGILFRKRRDGVLGDIINSAPIYVGPPNRGFPDDTWGLSAPETVASQKYSDFVASNESRVPVLYVGSNDGMMHGFKATHTAGSNDDDGTELLAYVPTPALAKLQKVSSPSYVATSHDYLVDGPVVAEDVFINGEWRTVVIGALGGGGQGYYALDVSDPTKFTENDAEDLVLWEFTDADHQELGYTYGAVGIGRFPNGKWMAVFGNGYNATEADDHKSADGNAYLFFVDIETGALVASVDTGVGINEDPASDGRPNGLSAPALVDVNNDYIIDYIYAGDLFGNLWKFDTTSNNVSQWNVEGGVSSGPLFVAKNADNKYQTILKRPEVGAHPKGIDYGVLIYFGTGKYLEVSDNSQVNQDTHSFYGIWDDLQSKPGTRSDLLKQTILSEPTVADGTASRRVVRVTSDNTIDWAQHTGWYIDFLDPSNTTDNRGERQVSASVLRNDRIIFTTLVPNADSCKNGGSGWLMELDAASGSRLSEAPFDLNNDRVYNYADLAKLPGGDGAHKVPPSALKMEGGIPAAPMILIRDKDEVKSMSLSSGDIESVGESVSSFNVGRQSWRQLQ